MSQHELDRAVARATGESVTTVRRLGFLLADPQPPDHDDELDADVIDWDEFEAQRSVSLPVPPLLAAAGC